MDSSKSSRHQFEEHLFRHLGIKVRHSPAPCLITSPIGTGFGGCDLAGLSLLESLDAFYLEHRMCGELDGGQEVNRVWLACSACEVRIEVRLEQHDDASAS